MIYSTLEDPSKTRRLQMSSYEQLRSSPCFPRRVMPRLKPDSTRLDSTLLASAPTLPFVVCFRSDKTDTARALDGGQ